MGEPAHTLKLNPWHTRAEDLARWAMARLVNRTDRCGKYYVDRETKRTAPFTAPKEGSRDGYLDHARLLRHFRAMSTDDVIGVHSYGADKFGKWAGIDIDNHDDKGDPLANENFAVHIARKAAKLDLCVLLYDSNGKGGFHLRTLFDDPIAAWLLRALGGWLVADYSQFGFAKPPEVFPKNDGETPWGGWLRVPGRHHTRDVWPRVWGGEEWLQDSEAVDYVLSLKGCPGESIPAEAATFGIEVDDGNNGKPSERPAGVVYPWEDFNAKATVGDVVTLLERHDWQRGRARADGAVEVIRPGKSARDGQGGNVMSHGGKVVFFCFTDAARPLKEMKGYAPSALVAILEHGGDFSASNKKLQEQGYGKSEVAKRKKPGEPIPPAPVEPPTAPLGSELIVTPLATLKVRPVRYLVPGRIPLGKLLLCGGRGGDGKSTLWRSIAADLSVGRCVLGLKYDKPIKAKTLIVAAEDGPQDTILPGLLAEGADVSKIAIIEGVRRSGKRTDFTLAPEHVELVRQRLKLSPDIKMVILDPIASFVGRAKIDDHRASELRLLLDPLSALAESAGVTIVMIAHLNKSTGDAVDRIAGSAAYRDTVRAAYLVCQDPDDDTRRLFMPFKDNLPGFLRTTIPFTQVQVSDGEAAKILALEQFRHLTGDDLSAARSQLRRVRYETPTTVDPNEAMKAKKSSGPKVERCKEWLRALLKDYAYPSDEILKAAKTAGYTFDNLKEAKAELKDDGVISHSNSAFSGEKWWSGPGLPATWIARPSQTPPLSPHTHSPPLSPQRELETFTGEWGVGSGSGGGEPVDDVI